MSSRRCPECEGQGYIEYYVSARELTYWDDGGAREENCQLCNQTGKISRRKYKEWLRDGRHKEVTSRGAE